MIGIITWTGHVTCEACPTQTTNIEWGEGRKTLRRRGWKQLSVDGKLRWHCPNCSKGRIERAAMV